MLGHHQSSVKQWLLRVAGNLQSRSFPKLVFCLNSSNINVLLVLFAQVLMELFEDLMAYAKARFRFSVTRVVQRNHQTFIFARCCSHHFCIVNRRCSNTRSDSVIQSLVCTEFSSDIYNVCCCVCLRVVCCCCCCCCCCFLSACCQ